MHYAIRGMAMPEADVHVALTTPSGDTVTWGAPDAADSVRGPMLEDEALAPHRGFWRTLA